MFVMDLHWSQKRPVWPKHYPEHLESREDLTVHAYLIKITNKGYWHKNPLKQIQQNVNEGSVKKILKNRGWKMKNVQHNLNVTLQGYKTVLKSVIRFFIACDYKNVWLKN